MIIETLKGIINPQQKVIRDLKICLERPREWTIESVFHVRHGGTGVTLESDYGPRSKVISQARCPHEKVSMGAHYSSVITKVINTGNIFPLTMLKRSMLLKKMCSRLRPVVSLMVLLASSSVPHRMLSGQGLSPGGRLNHCNRKQLLFHFGSLAELRRINAWNLLFRNLSAEFSPLFQ